MTPDCSGEVWSDDLSAFFSREPTIRCPQDVKPYALNPTNDAAKNEAMFIVDVLASPNRVNARIVALGAVHIDSKPICPVLRPAKTFCIALGISM